MDAIIRETREEIGLQLDRDEVRLISSIHYKAPEGHSRIGFVFTADRVREAQDQADQLERHLHKVLEQEAPTTLSVFALGPDTAAALVISIGDNRDRLTSEAAFARRCGVAPIPPLPLERRSVTASTVAVGEFTQQVCAGALSLNPAIAPRRTRLGRFGRPPVGTTSGFLAANSW